MSLVLFDLGGVLVELDPSWPRRVDRDPAAVFAWLAGSEAFAAFERGELGEHAFFPEFARAFDLPDPHVLAAAFDRWVVGHLPGALDLLDALPGPRALLSNTNVRHWACFDPERDLRSRAGVALPSHLIGARKPDPEVWIRAEALLGGPPALFLDDGPAIVAAARAHGWTAEVVRGPAEARAALTQHGLLPG